MRTLGPWAGSGETRRQPVNSQFGERSGTLSPGSWTPNSEPAVGGGGAAPVFDPLPQSHADAETLARRQRAKHPWQACCDALNALIWEAAEQGSCESSGVCQQRSGDRDAVQRHTGPVPCRQGSYGGTSLEAFPFPFLQAGGAAGFTAGGAPRLTL